MFCYKLLSGLYCLISKQRTNHECIFDKDIWRQTAHTKLRDFAAKHGEMRLR